MSKRKTARVEFMLKNFMELHESGYNIREIAQITGVSKETIYYYLDSIAKSNGVKREELLEQQHKVYVLRKRAQEFITAHGGKKKSYKKF